MMDERPETDIPTAERADSANSQPAYRPLSTSDLATVDRPAPPTELAPPAASDQMRSKAGFPPQDLVVTKQKTETQSAPLFSPDRARDYRSRWDTIQTGFVDEPRDAVDQADTLVAEVIQQLAKSFADERSKLEQQGNLGDNISTEDFRLALRRYRSFFDRLLTV
jgi:hypothetical protein